MIGEVTRAQVAASGPTATLLYDDWYPALRASAIGGKRMAKAMLLGIPLVLGRTAAGNTSPCAMPVRIAAFRSPTDGSMASR